MVRAKLDDEEMFKHALELIDTAEKQGVYLRLLGAMAIRMHIQDTEFMDLYDKLSRLGLDVDRKFTDIDFIAYKKQLKGIRNVFEKELGFKVDRMMLQYLRDRGRLIYYAPDNAYHVDVFFDKLEFSHNVHFGKDPKEGRLHLDSPTIPLADIILQKTQIHKINEKDIKDIIILLRTHDLIETEKKDDPNLVNIKYIAQVLADDWGFWKDATENFQKVKSFTEKYWNEENLITEEDAVDVIQKVDRLLETIENEPKTKNWNKRAKKGESKQWWRDVEEVER